MDVWRERWGGNVREKGGSIGGNEKESLDW